MARKKSRKLGSQLTCPSSEPLSHSLTHFASQLPPFRTEETCTWSVAFGEDAGTHMAGFLPVSCPLSSPPAAALGLLHLLHCHCAGTFLSLLCWISRSPHLLPKESHITMAIWVSPIGATHPGSPSGALRFLRGFDRAWCLWYFQPFQYLQSSLLCIGQGGLACK